MTYLPPLTRKTLAAAPRPSGPTFVQGFRMQGDVLDILFLNKEGEDVSPFAVTYALGTASPYDFNPIGSPERKPLMPRIGRYRPNFMVGDDWYTGAYECRWSIIINEGDAPAYRSVPFNVCTAGTSDISARSMGVFDMSATVFVI